MAYILLALAILLGLVFVVYIMLQVLAVDFSQLPDEHVAPEHEKSRQAMQPVHELSDLLDRFAEQLAQLQQRTSAFESHSHTPAPSPQKDELSPMAVYVPEAETPLVGIVRRTSPTQQEPTDADKTDESTEGRKLESLIWKALYETSRYDIPLPKRSKRLFGQN